MDLLTIGFWISLVAGTIAIVSKIVGWVQQLLGIGPEPAPPSLPDALAAASVAQARGTHETPAVRFTVPFSPNPRFVGRERDLARLHAVLQGDKPVGIVGVTGLGGIGKTQLAVEYAYQYQRDFPGGVYWIDAAGELLMGVASCAYQAGLCDRGANLNDADIQSAVAQRLVDWLRTGPKSLLILDNLQDPSHLNAPLLGHAALSALPCQILFTTRNASFDTTLLANYALDVLPREASIEVLLGDRQKTAQQDAGETAAANDICAMLGDLVLAIWQAGAYLRKWSDVTLAGYRDRLEDKGRIEVADSTTPLRERELPIRHKIGIKLVLQESISHLRCDGNAYRALCALAEFRENEMVPRSRVALAAHLTHEPVDGLPSELSVAVDELRETSLVDLVEGGMRLRLHPLVREFARDMVAQNKGRDAWVQEVAHNYATGLSDLRYLERRVKTGDGIRAVLEDCAASPQLVFPKSEEARLIWTLRGLLVREEKRLTDWDRQRFPSFFLQQVRNRALEIGSNLLCEQAEQLLKETAGVPWLKRVLTHEVDDPALLRVLSLYYSTEVLSVSFSPDGQLLVSGCTDGTVRLLEAFTGEEQERFYGHTGWVRSVAFSPDGRWIASGSSDRTIRIWALNSRQEWARLKGHHGAVTHVAFSSDGELLASSSFDRVVRIWETSSGKELAQLRGHTDGIWGVAFSPDGQLLASGSRDRTVRVWEVSSGREKLRLKKRGGYVLAVSFSPNGRLIAYGCAAGIIQVWNVSQTCDQAELEGHAPSVWSVAFSPEGNLLASGSDDRTVRVWETDTGRERARLEGHYDRVWSVAFSADGETLASGGNDGTVRLWEVDQLRQRVRPSGHTRDVSRVALCPNGEIIASSADYDCIRIWDVATGRERAALGSSDELTSGFAVSPTGTMIASGLVRSGDIYMWRLPEPEEALPLRGHTAPVQSVVFSPGGSLLASGSDDRTICVWDAKTRQLRTQLIGHTARVNSVAFSADGTLLTSGSDDKTVRVWQIASHRELGMLGGHSRGVNLVAFAPDARTIASYSTEGVIQLWEIATHHIRLVLQVSDLLTMAFSPDGAHLITSSGSRDSYGLRSDRKPGLVQVWQLASGKEIARYPTPSTVLSVGWLLGGRIIAVDDGGYTRQPHVYQLELVEPERRNVGACPNTVSG